MYSCGSAFCCGRGVFRGVADADSSGSEACGKATCVELLAVLEGSGPEITGAGSGLVPDGSRVAEPEVSPFVPSFELAVATVELWALVGGETVSAGAPACEANGAT